MSLLQDVLRTQTLDSLDKKLASAKINGDDHHEDSEDELVNVVRANYLSLYSGNKSD